MKTWTTRWSLVAALIGGSLAVPTSTRAQDFDPALEPAEWLAGCWRLERGTVVIDEQWMAPRGNAMVGMARTVRDGAMRGFELVRIIVRDGGLVYVADPSGQTRTEFPATAVEGERIVFENPEHDFPTKIEYIAQGDSLVANVSAGERGFQQRMARVACGGPTG